MMDEQQLGEEQSVSVKAGADTAGLGVWLRHLRDTQGLSVSEVAKELCLNRHVIEAIERDVYPDEMAPVYVRGYVKSYARFLGVNESEMTQRLQKVKWPESPSSQRPPTVPMVETVSVHRTMGRSRLKWGSVVLLVLVFAVAAVWFSRAHEEHSGVVSAASQQAIVLEPAHMVSHSEVVEAPRSGHS